MKKRNLILLTGLLAAALGGLAWLMLRPPEPEPAYGGKPLSYWLRGYDPRNRSGTNAALAPTEQEANWALRHIGTNAMPMLLRLLREPDSSFKERFFALARKQHFFKVPPSKPSINKWHAFWALRKSEFLASNSVPQLMAIYDARPGSVSQQMVPLILADVGPSAKEAVPLLIRATTNANEFVRMNAIFALGKIRAEPELVVPALIKCLRDSSRDVQANAASSLASFGHNAESSVPALLELLKDNRAGSNSVTGGRTEATWGVGIRPLARPGLGGFPVADVAGAAAHALNIINRQAAIKAGVNLPLFE